MNSQLSAVLIFLVLPGFGFGQDFRRARRGAGTDASPSVGELAPTFVLKSLDGKSKFDLRDFRDEQPVVLFFGSYT